MSQDIVRSRAGKARSVRALLAAACAAASVAVALGPAASATTRRAAAAGSLTIGQTNSIQDLDPYHLLIYNYTFNNQLFDPLVRENLSLQPQPGLATSWQETNQGKALILHLRKGVHFTNGDAFTSADVAFSVKYAADPSNGANIVGLAKQVTAIQTPNPYEVVLRYAEPNPAAFDLLIELYVLDAKQGDKAATDGNGTGPYRLVSYQPGLQATMAAKTNYWGPAPKIKKIVAKVFPSEQTALEALRGGSIQMVYDVSAPGFKSVQHVKGITGGTAGRMGANNIAVQINVKQVPNVHVRRALGYILDRPAIAHAIGGPLAVPLCLPFAKGSPAYFKSLASQCDYSLSKAKAEMAKAGSSAGLDLTINTSTQLNPIYTQLAEIVQANAAQIGLHLKVNDIGSTAYNNANAQSQFQLESKPYGRGSDDPATLFGAAASFYTTGNPSQFNDQDFVKAVNDGATTLEQAARAKAYRTAELIILKSAFVIPVAAIPWYWVSSSKLSGVQSNTDGLLVLGQASL